MKMPASPSHPDPDPGRALSHYLAPVARGWRGLADAALAQLGVSNSAAWCLIHIARIGPQVRQAALAQALDVRQPSLVRTIDQLQAAGLVVRQTDPGDKRSNHVALTPAGQQLVGRIEAELDRLRAELLEGIPAAGVEIMVELLDLLNRRIAERRALPGARSPE